MDCIPYINDLLIEIDMLNKLDNGNPEIRNKIIQKEKLIEDCKNNLLKLSNYKIEYRLYLYILNGLNPTKAVRRVADENYLNDITPCDPSSIWRKYQKMNEILSK